MDKLTTKKRKKCAVCGDMCQTNVIFKWRRDCDGIIFHVCARCAEAKKVDANSVKVNVKKSYTTIEE